MGEQRAAHLVRHLVSARSVIILTAEAGLHNNKEGWTERQNTLVFTVAKLRVL